MDSTLRQQIRDWWREQLKEADEIDLKVAAGKGALVLRQNPEFCERFFEEFLQPMIYTVGINLLSQRRANLGSQSLSGKDAAHAIGEDIEDALEWMEHDPASGKHISLFKMTKEQGIAAIQERETRIAPDVHRIAMMRLAFGRLKPGQRLGDVWSLDDLIMLDKRIIIGKPKITLGPVGGDLRKETAA